MTCKSCIFYDSGNCIINPPTVIVRHNGQLAHQIIVTVWPTVRENEICGKYQSGKPIIELTNDEWLLWRKRNQ